jgi:hypothetical protein
MDSTGVRPDAEPKPQRFVFFISHASEDNNIAIAVNNALQTAAGPSAEVFMDEALHFGTGFSDEIFKKLDETNVLVVIHSTTLKPAFGYTGLELGYFIRVMERETRPDFPRRIVPIYRGKPPDAIAGNEGVDLDISRITLNMTVEDYKTTLNKIDYNYSAVKFLREFQELIDSVRLKHGAPKIPRNDEQKDLPGIVVRMQLAIFNHLKNTPDAESELKPQLQITIVTSDDALAAAGEDQLPNDALLKPMGTGTPMAIFGLPSVETTWGAFKQQKPNRFRDSWIDAITNVVTFSMKNQLRSDNTQVIVSYDAESAYRVILTAGDRTFNGDRKFNLYFVECLRPGDFGDPKTTLLLKGLELLCRFRSLFLEERSEFSSVACRVAKADAIKEFACGMERQLNLLHRDALQAKLDSPGVWLGLVEPDHLIRLSDGWRPFDSSIPDALTNIRRSEPGTVENCRQSLVTILREMEETMRPLNAGVIAEMADELKKTPPSAN